jgi:hypothetical protein
MSTFTPPALCELRRTGGGQAQPLPFREREKLESDRTVPYRTVFTLSRNGRGCREAAGEGTAGEGRQRNQSMTFHT